MTKWYEIITRTYSSSSCLITLETGTKGEATLTCRTSNASLKKGFLERGYLEKREYRPFHASPDCSTAKIGPTSNEVSLIEFISLIAQHEDLAAIESKIVSKMKSHLERYRAAAFAPACSEGAPGLSSQSASAPANS